LTSPDVVEIPRESGDSLVESSAIPVAEKRAVKSVIIAAEPVDGNYGGSCYGLSAVRFVARY